MNILRDDNNNELAWLREKNARLKELLQKHEIEFEPKLTSPTPHPIFYSIQPQKAPKIEIQQRKDTASLFQIR